MSAERLREAAASMRERASKATPSPWVQMGGMIWERGSSHLDFPVLGDLKTPLADVTHIASWHPAVALAVADWLDMVAGNVENYGPNAESPWVRPHVQRALAVADAYLGTSDA